jgi:hypothetical protein
MTISDYFTILHYDKREILLAHLTVKSAYKNLADRLNRFPQGAPPSDVLYKILEVLFSGEEAEFVSKLSIKPFTAEKAARLNNKSLTESKSILKNSHQGEYCLMWKQTMVKLSTHFLLRWPASLSSQ